MSYDVVTWSDIAYAEQHGHYPDKGSTASELREWYGDNADPEEVAATEQYIRETRLVAEIRRLRDILKAHGIDEDGSGVTQHE